MPMDPGSLLVCVLLTTITVPVAGAVTWHPLEQVIEIRYCQGGVPHIQIHRSLRDLDTHEQIGQSSLETIKLPRDP